MGYRITSLAVGGFKSIATLQSIKIAPLTILAGANSSGKSSIMQPLLLLKQTLEAPRLPAGALAIDGENVKFTSSEQFLTRDGAGRFDIEIGVGGNASVSLTFARTAAGGLETVKQRWSDDDKSHEMRPDSSVVWQDRFWLRPGMPDSGLVENIRAHVTSGAPPITYLDLLIRTVIHVPALRGQRQRLYRAWSPGPMYPATFDDYTASVILFWQSENIDRYQLLNQDLADLGLAERVEASKRSETELELRVNRLTLRRTGDLVSVADVGFGVSQTLPVLVALRAADADRLVYLEEPEIHLHPRAQTKLADILAGAAKRGVRIVAETHSTLLLTAIQTLVAKGELSPELVKLHWFQRDPHTGITQVTSADLDENGAFGDWPEDFDRVILDTDRAYLDAVEDRQVR